MLNPPGVIALFTLLGAAVVTSANSQPTANSCTDPYWSPSLRCIFAGAQPQPVPPPPSIPAQVRDFTRVDLDADWDIRCLDGTRPVLYLDPAVGGPSNKWLISVTGGGNCSALDSDGLPGFEDGQECYDAYLGDVGGMSTAFEPAMKDLGLGPGGSQGINRPRHEINTEFAGFHRVRIEKCSYDRYNGRATHGVEAVAGGGANVAFTLFQHGKSIVELALDTLRGDAGTGLGLSYPSWSVAGGAVVPVTIDLPPLEAAEVVLFVGHSASAHGLVHNIDGLAERLSSWPVFAADVRAVFDAHFLPALEGEAFFNGSGDFYDQVWAGAGSAVGIYDGEEYYTSSAYAAQYDAWLTGPASPLDEILDASCLATHAASLDTWKCRDKYHVLFNHVATPMFVREDFDDPNIEHTNQGTGHRVAWGEWADYPHCAAMGFTPCPPVLATGLASAYRDRLEQQAATLIDGFGSRSELALGIDSSAAVPSVYFWLPACASHEGAYLDQSFFQTAIEDPSGFETMHSWLREFMAAPANGIVESRIDGAADTLSRCDYLFADGFESGDLAGWGG